MKCISHSSTENIDSAWSKIEDKKTQTGTTSEAGEEETIIFGICFTVSKLCQEIMKNPNTKLFLSR